MITLNDYIKEKGITAQEFSNITGISYSRLSVIKNVVNPKVDLETVSKVYTGTRERFGEGLSCFEWLDTPKFWEK